jgi:starch phosphorylase
MRILVDLEGYSWEKAWNICTKTFNYTNHTLMSEALEKWSVDLLGKLLPRHLEIIYEINFRFLREVSTRFIGDNDRISRMSLIQEYPQKMVRMAYMCVAASGKVNGVAALHTELLKNGLFRDFNDLYPDKFINVTNGITPRRWLKKANPGLSSLITEKIGTEWVKDLSCLSGLEKFAEDSSFLGELQKVKRANKVLLANHLAKECGFSIDPDSLFDVQVKRLHEYKRQLLNALHVVMLYLDLKDDPDMDFVPRTVMFGAKAAPGYYMAKLIIKLINNISNVINADPQTNKKLKMYFIPNYRVSLAEKIIPAANVSEQISLAGTEASGTGNMKLMLNGALTLGTLDGANVEIAEEVGDENIFIFGLKTEEVDQLRPTYNSRAIYESDPEIKRALDMIRRNVFSLMTPGIFEPLLKNLLDFNDYYMLLKDLPAYIKAQDRVEALYRNPKAWTKASLMNTACAGKFSSDRTIAEYAKDIWHLDPFIAK